MKTKFPSSSLVESYLLDRRTTQHVHIFTIYRNRLWVYEADSLGPLLPPYVTMSIVTIKLCFGLSLDFIKLHKWTDSTLILWSPSFCLQAAKQIIHKNYLAIVCTQSVWRGNGMLLQPQSTMSTEQYKLTECCCSHSPQCPQSNIN